MNLNYICSPETLNSGQNRWFFVLCDLEIWQMTLTINRAPLLHYVKLCPSFRSHRWIQTWVTVQKRSIRVKIGNFFVPRDLEIWWMTLENNKVPLVYYAKLCASFQSHGDFKLKLQSGNAQFVSKLAMFLFRVTSKFDNRAPLLYNIKFCPPFQSYRWI